MTNSDAMKKRPTQSKGEDRINKQVTEANAVRTKTKHSENAEAPNTTVKTGDASVPNAVSETSASASIASATAIPVSTATPAAEPTTKKRGRPKDAKEREPLQVRLDPDNLTTLKMRGVMSRATFSDVMNALILYHIDDLTDDEIALVKAAKKEAF